MQCSKTKLDAAESYTIESHTMSDPLLTLNEETYNRIEEEMLSLPHGRAFLRQRDSRARASGFTAFEAQIEDLAAKLADFEAKPPSRRQVKGLSELQSYLAAVREQITTLPGRDVSGNDVEESRDAFVEVARETQQSLSEISDSLAEMATGLRSDASSSAEELADAVESKLLNIANLCSNLDRHFVRVMQIVMAITEVEARLHSLNGDKSVPPPLSVQDAKGLMEQDAADLEKRSFVPKEVVSEEAMPDETLTAETEASDLPPLEDEKSLDGIDQDSDRISKDSDMVLADDLGSLLQQQDGLSPEDDISVPDNLSDLLDDDDLETDELDPVIVGAYEDANELEASAFESDNAFSGDLSENDSLESETLQSETLQSEVSDDVGPNGQKSQDTASHDTTSQDTGIDFSALIPQMPNPVAAQPDAHEEMPNMPKPPESESSESNAPEWQLPESEPPESEPSESDLEDEFDLDAFLSAPPQDAKAL